MSVGFVVDPQAIFPETEMGAAVHTALLFTVDDSLLGLLVLGAPLAKGALSKEEHELLRGLTANCMVFLSRRCWSMVAPSASAMTKM
jgi:hypothetical protein